MRFLLLLIFCLSLGACDTMSQQKAKLKTKQDSVSYSIGFDIGRNMKRQELELDLNVMLSGMKDAMADAKDRQLTDEQMQGVLMAFQTEMMAKMQEKRQKQSDENTKKGKDFLDANAKKEGVKTLPNGLQYKVLASGKAGGKTPSDTSVVKAHYKGTLIDGTEFDSSYKRGQPLEIPVNGVIKGWQEALKMMKVGDKWQLFIPADLGYGASGAPPTIPPNATLIFEMELIDVVK